MKEMSLNSFGTSKVVSCSKKAKFWFGMTVERVMAEKRTENFESFIERAKKIGKKFIKKFSLKVTSPQTR